MFARGDNPQNVVNARNRYHPEAHYPAPEDMGDIPEDSRIPAMIARALRGNPQQRIVIRGGGFPAGLYAPTGETGISARGNKYKKVRAVQLFDRQPKKPKPFDWRGIALSAMQGFVQKAFGKNAAFYAKKAAKNNVGIK
jgi:hypothetical protein